MTLAGLLRSGAGAAVVAAWCASLSVVGVAAGTAEAGWWDEAAKAREATLEDVSAAADRWRDVPVSLVVRFDRALVDPAGPAAAPASDWIGFAAASKSGVASDGFVVRRGSAEAARLATLRAGDEIRLRAVVRVAPRAADAPIGAEPRPLLEVVFVAGAADALSPEELATLRRAEDLIAKDNAGAAETLVRSVLDGRTFVPAVRAELWRRIARAQRSQRNLTGAAQSFAAALEAAPADPAAARELAELKAVIAVGPQKLALPTDASARASRPLPDAPAAIPVPPVAPRLAPPRDRDAAASATPNVAPNVAATVPTNPPAPTQPPAPARPTPTDELLPPPAPKLAAPR